MENGAFKYAKLLDRKMIPDSVEARHIFLSIAGAQSQDDVVFTRELADTLTKLLLAGASFDDLVLQYSDDNSTKFSSTVIGVG